MPPLLVPYDPQWPVEFERIAAEIREAIGRDRLIEHIGSTAIPGMPAKPIIDVAVRMTDAGEFAAHRTALEAHGWRLGSGVRSHPVMVFEVHGIRTRIAHFFSARGWDAVNQRLLRDRLRADPADAALYLHAKRAAAEAAARGEAPYNAGKTAVIQEITDRARASVGLPSVPVSDK